MMKANEELTTMRLLECPECHYSSEHEDWKYKDFTSRSVVVCPQCKCELNLTGY